MLHLAIQTVEKPDNFCLMDDDKVIFQKFIDGTDFSSDSLFSQISKALGENKIEANEIEFVTCVVGPGSFTGIKSGLSFAKGFAYGLKIPIVSISSLEALAFSVRNDFNGDLMAMIDARNERVYAQVFTIKNAKLQEKSDIFVDEIEKILKSHKKVSLIGSGAIINSEFIKSLGDYEIIQESIIDSANAGILGFGKFKRKEYFDAHSIKPIFISEPKITLN